MKPRKFGFSPITVVIALAAVMMLWSFYMNKGYEKEDMSYSSVMRYFETLQVTAVHYNPNTSQISLSLKEGELPLPEKEDVEKEEPKGLLATMFPKNEDALIVVKPGGAVMTMDYTLPYAGFFISNIEEYQEEYNLANPEAPMDFDMDALQASFPWEMVMYVILIGVTGFIFFSMMRSGGAGGGMMNVGRAKVKDESEKNVKTTFEDVAGEEEEKEELQEVVEFLKNPERFNGLGARIPHGVLLVGPPGTGKTLLARACAGEAGVPFYSISGSDFVEMYVGVGASRVRDLFDKAKKTMPCIIFIDEIDAVGRQRGAGLGGSHDEREQTLNQMLVEMDGFQANEGVIVIAATNRADILDKALLRPGRFDRQVYVGLPDVKGREDILKVHTKKKPLAPDVSLKVIAQRTAGFAGADLENLVNEAALLAARRNRKAITMKEIEEASIKVVAGPEKRSRVVTPEEKKLTAYHEAGHAVAGYFCEHHPRVHEITIIPRGQAGGYTMYLPEKDRSYVTKGEMFEDMVSLLGGRVAEELILDDISTGASNDLQRATSTARNMVTRYGFSERLGSLVYGTPQEETFLGRDFSQGKGYSEATAAEIDAEMRDIMDQCYENCRRILTEHMDLLHALANALLEREKLGEEEFRIVMEGGVLPPFHKEDDSTPPLVAEVDEQVQAAAPRSEENEVAPVSQEEQESEQEAVPQSTEQSVEPVVEDAQSDAEKDVK